MLKLRHTVSQVNESTVVGRASDKEKIINMLLNWLPLFPLLGCQGWARQLLFNWYTMMTG